MPTTRIYPYQLHANNRWIWYFVRFITGADSTYTGPGWKIIDSYSYAGTRQDAPIGGTSSSNLHDSNGWNSSHVNNAGGIRVNSGDWIVLSTNRGGSNTECQVYIKIFQATATSLQYTHFYLLPLADYVAGTAPVERNIDLKGLGLVMLGTSGTSMASGFKNCMGGVPSDPAKNIPLPGLYDMTDGEGSYWGYENNQAGTTYNFHYHRSHGTWNQSERFSFIADEATCVIWWTDESSASFLYLGLFDSIYLSSEDTRPFCIGGGHGNSNDPYYGGFNRYSTGQTVSGSHTLRVAADVQSALTGYPGSPFGKKPILPWGVHTYGAAYQGFQGYLRLFWASNENLGLMGTLQDKNYCFHSHGDAYTSRVHPWDGVTDL